LNKKLLPIGFTAVLLIVTIITLIPKNDAGKVRHFTGLTMGTIAYNVKIVEASSDYTASVDSLLESFNLSLSTYIPESEISQFNQSNELLNPSKLFKDVLEKSWVVFDKTNGAFDPTVGPLINLWGFGPKKERQVPDTSVVDSTLLLVSLDKVKSMPNKISKDEYVQLDFSAIAKGQAVDEVAKWIESKGHNNYMVEIGGEVRCSGTNEKGNLWAIGIEDPLVSLMERKLLAIAKLENRALATSGNYRNYYERDGQLYAHIVDPRTGYTANHNLLSASVFASDCMTADAYATAFMVLGLEESVQLVEADPTLDAVFIFRSDDATDIYVSTGITDFIDLKEMPTQ
jgi:thiamine biosynthesis lipoprotein